MSPIPQDMRAMFLAECEDYLARLTEGFLSLESEPGNPAVVDQMFRVAHSLKGTSRIMNCMDLHAAAHGLENLLVQLRDGKLALASAHFDALSGVMDQFRELLQATLDEGDTEGPSRDILAVVKACQDGATPVAEAIAPTPATPPPPPAVRPAPAPPAPPSPPPAETPPLPLIQAAGPTSSALDVLKVPVSKLDALINQVGELMVAHQRLATQAEAALSLGDFLEEASRRGSKDRTTAAQAVQKAQRLAQSLADEEASLGRLFESLETAVHRTRMVPLSVLFDQAPKWVRDSARAMGKSARLLVSGTNLEIDKHVMEGLRDPLVHLLRNAVDHGIESPETRMGLGKPEQGLLRLTAHQDRDGVALVLQDDGRGLDYDAIRQAAERKGWPEALSDNHETLAGLLFRPGFSTREVASEFSGRGVGLDVVATQVAALKGTVRISGEPGKGTEIRLWLPQSLTRSRALLVQASGLTLGLQSASIRACLRPLPGAFQALEGRPMLVHDEEIILLVHLGALLGRQQASGNPAFVVVLEGAGERIALGVDNLLGESEVLQKALPSRLHGLDLLNGLSLLGDGQIVLMADPPQLVTRARHTWQGISAPQSAHTEATRPRNILLADDSLTTRVQLRRILESAGYKVQPAVDGLDAWARLGKQAFDAVVSDVQMPGLDGCQLTARIRATPALAHLPVVLVTTLATEEDQRRGLEAGASAYITKGSFDQEQLLEHLRRLA